MCVCNLYSECTTRHNTHNAMKSQGFNDRAFITSSFRGLLVFFIIILLVFKGFISFSDLLNIIIYTILKTLITLGLVHCAVLIHNNDHDVPTQKNKQHAFYLLLWSTGQK